MWLPQKNENCQRAHHYQPSPQTGPQEINSSLNTTSAKFPKSSRILTRNHYHGVYRAGNKLVGETVIVDYRLGKSLCPRLGITVSKRYGKAHDRNRFKRVVREAFRARFLDFPQDLEINVLPKFPIRPPHKQAILDDLTLLITKLIKKTTGN